MLTLQDPVSGNGFLARITMSGRALMREDDGKWWMYGIRPAGIAASGGNIEETFVRFRNRYKEILFDIAEESHTFEDFASEVDRFFNESDADNEDERSWEMPCLLFVAAVANLQRRSPICRVESPETHPSFIKVERVDAKAPDVRLMASNNVVDSYAYSFPKAA
jgi:hypothetical protein